MKMTFERKLERIAELIERRKQVRAELDSVESEIAGFMEGGGPKSVVIHDKSKDVRKKPACSVCGGTGHNVMTCPKGKGTHPNNPVEYTRRASKVSDEERKEIEDMLLDGMRVVEIFEKVRNRIHISSAWIYMVQAELKKSGRLTTQQN